MSDVIVSNTRLGVPQLSVREWRRALRSEPLSKMIDVANHLQIYRPLHSFAHFFAERWTTGEYVQMDALVGIARRGENDTFWGNPNFVNPHDARLGLAAEGPQSGALPDSAGTFTIEQIWIPHTSPHSPGLQVVLEYQGHEFNLDPLASNTYRTSQNDQDPHTNLYGWLRNRGFIPSTLYNHLSGELCSFGDGHSLEYVNSLRNYVDNPRTNENLPDADKLLSSNTAVSTRIFFPCQIAMRLKDTSGTVIDPPGGGVDDWAMILNTNNGGLQGGGLDGLDVTPPRTLQCMHRALSPGANGATPRALEYGTQAGSGSGAILEIGYQYVKPLVASISEIPPLTVQALAYPQSSQSSGSFPSDFPTTATRPTGSTAGGGINAALGALLYEDHIYLHFQLNNQNGVVFFPEPPASSWPLVGLDLSDAGVAANPNLFYGDQEGSLSPNSFTYNGNHVLDRVRGELVSRGPEIFPAYTGAPVPGETNLNNHWLTAPASNPEFANMGEMVLANGGKVWHPHFGNMPNETVITDGFNTNSYNISAESGTRMPVVGERVFVRVPVSSITAWNGTLAQGDLKSMTAFCITDNWLREQGYIYHAQSANDPSVGGIGDELRRIWGMTFATRTTLEVDYNFASIKAKFDQMGIP